MLLNDNDTLTSSPIVNGQFSLGMTGWETEIVGHGSGQTPGTVNTLGGFAQLTENQSFLTAIKQTFTVPPSPQTISFDIASLGLEDPAGGVPDAFEVSLLDNGATSLVATHRPEATSFFNAVGQASSLPDVSLAPGVTFNGTTVTVDISGIAPDTEATLYSIWLATRPASRPSRRSTTWRSCRN